MKKLIASLSMIFLLAAATIQAAPITGAVNFAGNVDVIEDPLSHLPIGLDFQALPIPGYFSFVGSASGTYSALVGQSATFNDFTFSPFNPPIDPLWTINHNGNLYSYTMEAANFLYAPGRGLSINSTGTLFATGYDPTPGIWSFTTQDGYGTMTFSATSAVPEPSTLLLLGLGLAGLGLARKRFAKS